MIAGEEKRTRKSLPAVFLDLIRYLQCPIKDFKRILILTGPEKWNHHWLFFSFLFQEQKRQKINKKVFLYMVRPKHLLATKKHLQYCIFGILLFFCIESKKIISNVVLGQIKTSTFSQFFFFLLIWRLYYSPILHVVMGRIQENQLTNSITHVTVFFVLGVSLSFTYVVNGFERGLEAHFSTLIIDHSSIPLGHQNQVLLKIYGKVKLFHSFLPKVVTMFSKWNRKQASLVSKSFSEKQFCQKRQQRHNVCGEKGPFSPLLGVLKAEIRSFK